MILQKKIEKYSQGIARNIFIRESAFRDYFDLNGQMHGYEPTNIDRQYRANYQAKIKQIEYYGMCFFGMSILCLLIPLVGVSFGFTSWPQRCLNTCPRIPLLSRIPNQL
jgi:hypothetical protein